MQALCRLVSGSYFDEVKWLLVALAIVAVFLLSNLLLLPNYYAEADSAPTGTPAVAEGATLTPTPTPTFIPSATRTNLHTPTHTPATTPTNTRTRTPTPDSLTAALVPDPSDTKRVTFKPNGEWHGFELESSEDEIRVVVNPDGSDRILELASTSNEPDDDWCPPSQTEEKKVEDNDELYISACDDGVAKIQLWDESGEFLIREYRLRIDSIVPTPTPTNTPTITPTATATSVPVFTPTHTPTPTAASSFPTDVSVPGGISEQPTPESYFYTHQCDPSHITVVLISIGISPYSQNFLRIRDDLETGPISPNSSGYPELEHDSVDYLHGSVVFDAFSEASHIIEFTISEAFKARSFRSEHEDERQVTFLRRDDSAAACLVREGGLE